VRNTPVSEIDFEHFSKVAMHVGTVRSAAPNPKARVPAYVLEIDFGPLGTRTASAQLTERYTADDLVGRQVAAVLNFPPKRVAGVRSEVLVLAAVDEAAGTTLLAPTYPVADGTRIA
jgi:tRNA-binding protein